MWHLQDIPEPSFVRVLAEGITGKLLQNVFDVTSSYSGRLRSTVLRDFMAMALDLVDELCTLPWTWEAR